MIEIRDAWCCPVVSNGWKLICQGRCVFNSIATAPCHILFMVAKMSPIVRWWCLRDYRKRCETLYLRSKLQPTPLHRKLSCWSGSMFHTHFPLNNDYWKSNQPLWWTTILLCDYYSICLIYIYIYTCEYRYRLDCWKFTVCLDPFSFLIFSLPNAMLDCRKGQKSEMFDLAV